jgi:hypothetical protein
VVVWAMGKNTPFVSKYLFMAMRVTNPQYLLTEDIQNVIIVVFLLPTPN